MLQTAATVNTTAAILNLQSQIKTFQDALNHLPLPKPGSTETSFLAEHGSSLTGAKNYKPGDSAPKLQIGATGSYYPGVSLPTLTNVYDKYTSSSFKIPSQNKSTVVGPSANNSTQNITFNISGVSNPDEVVRQVMSKLNTANAKRNTSNLVGGHR
jgi:hypothetical protein